MTFESSQTFKSSYTFSEVSSVTSVKPYVLRFWEAEFPEINPTIHEDGSKTYSGQDLESILLIKNLLFEQKMSIPEAKAFISTSQIDEAATSIEATPVEASVPKPVAIEQTAPAEFQSIGMATKKLQYLLDKIDALSESRNWNL